MVHTTAVPRDDQRLSEERLERTRMTRKRSTMTSKVAEFEGGAAMADGIRGRRDR